MPLSLNAAFNILHPTYKNQSFKRMRKQKLLDEICQIQQSVLAVFSKRIQERKGGSSRGVIVNIADSDFILIYWGKNALKHIEKCAGSGCIKQQNTLFT
jgi:hypothetical protein